MHTPGAAPDRALFGIAALLFATGVAATVACWASMADMRGMAMPGGWTMSMTWMRMPGQSWFGAAGAFAGMWSVMMLAMMMPAILPALGEHGARHRRALTLRVAAAYFGVWIAAGLLIYPLGLVLAALEMRSAALARLVPALGAGVLVIAGILQPSAWKRRQLACCRAPRGAATPTPGAAWRHGISLGLRCCACCAPFTAALLVLGVMDLGAMVAATAAISLERLAARGAALARLSGALLLVAGVAGWLRAPAA